MTRAALLAVLLLARNVRADGPEPMYACKAVPASTQITVSVRPETSLADLAIWVTGFTCKNVVFGADVAKRATKVTVISSAPMSPAKAVKLFVDAVEATGLVVVQKPDTFIIKLGPGMPKACPDLADTSTSAPVPTTLPSSSELADADFDAGIKTIDATHASITRDIVDRVLGNPMAVAKGARVVASAKDGKPDGFKLYAIRPKSLYARLGFLNGDTLHRINGQELTSADKALEVYTSVRDAKALVVEITRSGKPLTLTISIR